MRLFELILIASLTTSSVGLASDLYHYNSTTGRCINSAGHTGLNSTSFEALMATGNGECADLSFLQEVWSADHLNATYTGWNLKGADLNRASALNVVLKSVELSGTQLLGLKGGYSYFEGKVDKYTQLPDRNHGGHEMADVDWSVGFPNMIGTSCNQKNNHIDCGQK